MSLSVISLDSDRFKAFAERRDRRWEELKKVLKNVLLDMSKNRRFGLSDLCKLQTWFMDCKKLDSLQETPNRGKLWRRQRQSTRECCGLRCNKHKDVYSTTCILMMLQNTTQDSVPSFDPVQPAVVSFLTPPPPPKKKKKKKKTHLVMKYLYLATKNLS